MLNFKFEVQNMILKQKKSTNDKDSLFCSFTFTTSEWKHLEKYVIFWTRKGKSTIRYLGKNSRAQCPVPEMVLNDLYFCVQVYANDEVLTQKLKVFTHEKVPVKDEKHEKNKLDRFFKKMEGKIDNIVYEDNKLLVFANNKLIKSINVVDANLVSKVLTQMAPSIVLTTALSPDSDLPVSSKVVYKALQNKLDKDSLARVAVTGSYNDLVDVPTEFNPAEHSHMANDIEDLETSLEEPIDDFIDDLIDKL